MVKMRTYASLVCSDKQFNAMTLGEVVLEFLNGTLIFITIIIIIIKNLNNSP